MPDVDVIEPKNFAELMQAMPAAWTLLLGVALVIGLVLWVFGGRLAKKGVMLTGFVMGGLGAMAAATALSSGAAVLPSGGLPEGVASEVTAVATSGGGVWVLAFGIGGAIAGLLLAWLLFRFWMGATAALLLAAVVPLAAMIWENNGPPLSAIQNTQEVTLDALGAGESGPSAKQMQALVDSQAAQKPHADAASKGSQTTASLAGPGSLAGVAELFDKQRFVEGLQAVWRQQVDEVKVWWQEMAPGSRWYLLVGAGVGAAIGLVLGLVAPLTAASLQSALMGSVLILFAGRTLLLKYVPAADGVMPSSWRGVLLSLGLITVLGVLVQWTLRRKKADD